MLGQVESS